MVCRTAKSVQRAHVAGEACQRRGCHARFWQRDAARGLKSRRLILRVSRSSAGLSPLKLKLKLTDMTDMTDNGRYV